MKNICYELPYEGAKEMLLVDEVDDREYLTGLFEAMYAELPTQKPRNKKQSKISFTGDIDMAIEYRKLTEKELDIFIEMRINQLREEGATEDIDLRPALKDYYNRHMQDGTFVSWLALDGNKIIGTSGMSFVEKPPYFGCPSGKMGLLSSMFTAPDYRRKGIAKELLSRVVDEARQYGCGTVQITASDMGVLLYTNFGFVKNGNFMQYKL
jgi:GNAT superfamily N-acetyltransferase